MITYQCDRCHKEESIPVNGTIMREKWRPFSPGNNHEHDRILCEKCSGALLKLRNGEIAQRELAFIDGII